MSKKSILLMILTVFICINFSVSIYAEPATSTGAVSTETTTESSDTATEEEDDSPAPHAKAALLIDMKSGKVLFSKNESAKMYPASTTKILTAIVTLENANLEDIVVAQTEAISPITNQHSHMGILIGEELSVEQLLYGMLVYSANDAANVLAVHTAGSIEAFCEKMNAKAKELGAKNTHFTNPHGFHDDNHYTTAEDIALIAKYAMQNEKFREIVSTAMYTIEPTNKYKEIRYLSNTNHLVSNRRTYEYYYKKATGIKTGFTDEAGSCLVSSAKDGETEFLAVVMNCENATLTSQGAYSFVDSKKLLQYGFENYKYTTIVTTEDIVADSAVYESKNNVRIALTPETPISALLPKGINLEEIEMRTLLNEKIAAPIEKGEILGTVECVYNGEVVGTANLAALNDVKRDYIITVIHIFVKIITNPVFIIVVLLLLFMIIRAKKIRNRKRRIRRTRLEHVSSDASYPSHRDTSIYKHRRNR